MKIVTVSGLTVKKSYLCGTKKRFERMKEPFDLEIFDTVYSIFPEGNETYTVFKEGVEYIQIQRDTESSWLKLHPDTGTPLFGLDEEVNLIGKAIQEQGG